MEKPSYEMILIFYGLLPVSVTTPARMNGMIWLVRCRGGRKGCGCFAIEGAEIVSAPRYGTVNWILQ